MATIEIWSLAAGLGLFIFSMNQLEVSLKFLAGSRLKDFLARNTNHLFRGILTGTLATAILQSSSVVILMLLTLVGAGLLSLKNAIGVVLGANLGTTFTGWIISIIGFKVDFNILIMPLLAIGSFGQAFLPKNRYFYSAKFLFYLALLFWGLATMKNSVADLGSMTNLAALAGFHPLVYLVAAFLFTAIIQSSSAAMMITLSALNSELIPFAGAAAMVIGADLGTTVTAILGSLKGSPDAKRIAYGHFIYNLVIDILAFTFLYPLMGLVQTITPQEPLVSLVLFHSSFNFFGILLFSPFVGRFTAFLETRFK